MILGGLQKLTLLDYPENVASTVFTFGCNFRCPFCHNASLVVSKPENTFDRKEIFQFLESRKNKLDGVCITGGEPLVNFEIFDFIRAVKDKGFKVKLDTNGSFPDKLKFLIDNKLVDYVAMDIKNSREKYAYTCGLDKIDISLIESSVDILKKSDILYEFRTTLVKPFHTIEDMEKIGQWLEGCSAYFLQQFVDSGNLIGEGCSAFSLQETENLLKTARKYVECAEIRGI